MIWLDENQQPTIPSKAYWARLMSSDGESAVFAVERKEQKDLAAREGKIHAIADSYEKPFRVALMAAFQVAKRKLAATKNVEASVGALKKALEQTLPTLVKRTMVAGGDLASGELKSAAQMRGAELRTAKRTSPNTKIDFAFDAENQAAIDWADRHAAELIDGISETSREQINNAIADLLETGDWKDAVDEIAAAVGDPDRAERIARHETMLAVSEGQRQSWDQAVEAGLLDEDSERTWITVGDEKVCPICEGLDGKTAKLGESYESDGEEYDGPPAHVSCRCTEGISG